MALIFGVEESFEDTGYDNTPSNSDDGWSETVDAGCTLNEDYDVTGLGIYETWLGTYSLYAEIDTDAGSNACADWSSASDQNDNFVRLVFHISQEGFNNNQVANILLLLDSSQAWAAKIQIGQSGNQVFVRMNYQDDGAKNSDGFSIDSYLSDWLMVKMKYHDGGGLSAAWEIILYNWTGSGWSQIDTDSGSITGATKTPRTIVTGLHSGVSGAQNTIVLIDRLWWDKEAYPGDPGVGIDPHFLPAMIRRRSHERLLLT